MSMFQVHLDGFDKIEQRLKVLPANIGNAGMAAASSYLVGVLVNKEIPGYKYISRNQVPWASEKQRRYVMAAIKRGEIDIPYHRTGKSGVFGERGDVLTSGVQGDWTINVANETRRVSISNNKAYAKWIYGSDQSKRLGLIGWKKMTRILAEYERNIVQAFDRGVKTAIKKLGFGQ